MKTGILWAGASVIALSLAAHAAQTDQTSTSDPDKVNIETVVVTASGVRQSIEDAPASITVVSGEQLKAEPFMSLTDALADVEGVSISGTKNANTPQLRGLPSNYSLSMVDGERINSQSNVFRYNDYDYSWIPLEAIERVEVVRGSMSSLYGSDAIAGVVNVITKPVTDHWMGSVTGSYTAQEDSQSGNSYQMNGFVSGPIVRDKVGIKAWAGYDRRLADGDVDNYDGIEDHHDVYAHGAVDYTPDADTKFEGGLTYTKSNHRGFPLERGGFSVLGEHDFGFLQSMVRVYGDRIHNAMGSSTSSKNPNTSGNMTVETRETIPLEDWAQTLTVGGDFRVQSLKDPTQLAGLPGVNYGTDPYSSVHQWSLYAQDQISLLPSLSLTVAERYDKNEKFGGHHSPKVYLIWHAMDYLTFRGGWSRAFKAPTLLQMSPNWSTQSCGGSGCYIIGNADLKPETSTSYEAGMQFHMDGYSASVTLFQIQLHDMIDYSHTSDLSAASSLSNFVEYLDADGDACTYSTGDCASAVFEYQNIEKARSQGVETAFDIPVSDTVKVHANYTYLDSRNLSSASQLQYQPNHTVNVRVNWQATPALSVFASSRFLGKQYIVASSYRESYMTFDLGARYQVMDHTTLRFGILNLTDRTPPRENSAENTVEGRRYFVSLTQNL